MKEKHFFVERQATEISTYLVDISLYLIQAE